MRAAPLGILLLTACGGASRDASAPEPTRDVRGGSGREARPAGRSAAPADAGPGPAAPSDAPAEPPSPKPPVAPPIAAACQGADLDLHALFAADACASTIAPAPFPADLTVTIDPPLRAKRGTPARGAIVIGNPTAAPIDLHLDARCGVDHQIETAIFDARGARADLITPCGPGGGGCGGGTMSLRIAPHGRARFPITVATLQRHQDATCEDVASKPLAAGTYAVDVRVLFLPRALKVPLVVTR